MNSSDDYYIAQLNSASIYLFKYVVTVLYVIGNIGNLLSIWIFSKKFWRKNVCVFYFTVYIFFNLCYINSALLSSIFTVGYNIFAQNDNVILCKIYIYVAYLFALISPSILILAFIDRLLISSQNVDTRLYSSKRLAYFSTSINTVFWIVFNSHFLVKVNIQQFTPGYFLCYYDLSKSYLDFVAYSVLIVHVFYGLTLFILSVLSLKNVRHIRVVPRAQRKEVRTMTKRDFQLLRCLFVQGVAFVMGSILFNINDVYATATRDQMQTPLQQTINSFLYNCFTFIYDVPYCMNFFIFISVSKAFRHDLKRLVYKICGKNLMVIREEENK